MIITTLDDSILLNKHRAKKIADFYGALKERTGKVEHWPSPEEIKSIWE